METTKESPLMRQANYSIADCLKELKWSRPAEAQEYLDEQINFLNHGLPPKSQVHRVNSIISRFIALGKLNEKVGAEIISTWRTGKMFKSTYDKSNHIKGAKEKALELYDIFKTVLDVKYDMRPGMNPFVKDCVKACCNQLLIERAGDKGRSDFYTEVVLEMEKLFNQSK